MYGLMFFTRLSIIGFYIITWLTGFITPISEMDLVLCIFIMLNYLWSTANIIAALLPPNYAKQLIVKSFFLDLLVPWLAASLLLKTYHASLNGSALFGIKSFWLIFGIALLWQKIVTIHSDE